MKSEDRARLESGDFDRAAWDALWDRLPPRLRRSTAVFVLQKLHAVESAGEWDMEWSYDSVLARSEAGVASAGGDLPGDVITFQGTMRVGPR